MKIAGRTYKVSCPVERVSVVCFTRHLLCLVLWFLFSFWFRYGRMRANFDIVFNQTKFTNSFIQGWGRLIGDFTFVVVVVVLLSGWQG